MLYQTYTARKAPEITPDRDRMVSSAAAACCLQRAHTIRMQSGEGRSVGSAKHVFCPWLL